LRIARDEWQWIELMPKIRLLSGEKERDRWLTQDEADCLIAAAAPHLQVLIRFALATGCRGIFLAVGRVCIRPVPGGRPHLSI